MLRTGHGITPTHSVQLPGPLLANEETFDIGQRPCVQGRGGPYGLIASDDTIAAPTND